MFSVLISLFSGKRFGSSILAAGVFAAVATCTAGSAAGSNFDPAGLQPAALNYTGTYAVRQIDPNLTGQGVSIAAVCRSMTYLEGQPQNDYRLNIDHKCFEKRNVNFVDGLDIDNGISAHATGIGAILIGRDPNAYHQQIGAFSYEGACPNATLAVHEFWRFLVNYVYGGKELKADILTLSVGGVFEDWWTRGIERLAEKNGLIVVAGAGNGTSAFDSVLYPAAGANVIGVGVVDSVRCEALSKSLNEFSLPRIEHSSCGPTGDMRAKPDIVAPGNCLVPVAEGNAEYDTTGDWSSFATPVVSGTLGLLVQKAKSQGELNQAVSEQGGNCVMKAILMNSAKKLPFWHKGDVGKEDDHEVPLDYIQGAGLLNALNAYEHLLAGQAEGEVSATGWDNNVITDLPGSEKVYRFEIPPAGADDFITATLVWNRHFDEEYPFEPVPDSFSDLRLELWAVNNDNPADAKMIDHSDSINDNVEHLYCPADPNYTGYKIVVTFSPYSDRKPEDIENTERYGLAWNLGKIDPEKSIWWYDLNGDNTVDNLDFGILLDNFNKVAETDEGYLLGDINMDGRIDIKDITILMKHTVRQTL